MRRPCNVEIGDAVDVGVEKHDDDWTASQLLETVCRFRTHYLNTQCRSKAGSSPGRVVRPAALWQASHESGFADSHSSFVSYLLHLTVDRTSMPLETKGYI